MDAINQHKFLRLLPSTRCIQKLETVGRGWQMVAVSWCVCTLVLSGTLLRSAEVQLHADLKDPYWYYLTEKGFFLVLSHILTSCYN